jgi:hypothetical protein
MTVQGYQIWHANNDNAVWPADYTHIATLDAASLEDAFARSNSIHSAWYQAADVVLVDSTRGYRSSSVGDVFRTLDGEANRVESRGFRKVYSAQLLTALRRTHWKFGTKKFLGTDEDGQAIEVSAREWTFDIKTRSWLDSDELHPAEYTLSNGDWELVVNALDFSALVDRGVIEYNRISGGWGACRGYKTTLRAVGTFLDSLKSQ